jgi:pilus assembly protein CpaB
MQLVNRMLSTRRGTLILGGVAAGLSALVLALYLDQYRSSVGAESEPITVLVAKTVIEKGMPGDVVGLKHLFDREAVPQSQLKEGAITDPATLHGRIAISDIYPGQPLTEGDFTASGGSIGTRLAGKARAIAVPLDPAHGLVGQVEAGDRVDVFAGFNVLAAGVGGQGRPVVKVLMQNALVLQAPRAAGGGVGAAGAANVLLRTTRDQAVEIAWAVDNGKVWLVLRPRAGAPPSLPGIATAESLLLGQKPVVVYGNVKRLLGGGGAR